MRYLKIFGLVFLTALIAPIFTEELLLGITSQKREVIYFVIISVAVVAGFLIFKGKPAAPPPPAPTPVRVAVVEEPPKKRYPRMPRRPEFGRGNTHGTARWEDPWDIDLLFNKGADMFNGYYYIGSNFLLNPLVHGLTVAGSGQGKGTCLIIPNLLSGPVTSWFVLDPKGENALITAAFQKRSHQKVVILDPWNEQKRLGATHGIEPMGFNPLSFVRANPDEMVESCGVIAEMLVPDNSRSEDSYWDSRARSLIKTYLLHMVTARPESEQHLGTLYKWLRYPIDKRDALWDEMTNNEECDELVKYGIGEFTSLDPDKGPFPSILSTAQNNTTFLESKPLRASLEKSDFDPYELTNGETTVYLILPERFLSSHSRWLRLVVGICLKACNYRPDKRVNFLLDEFAILGKMPDIQRAYAFARGQNISIWAFVQSLTQLNEIYGEQGASAFLANARLRQFFGIYDLHTQKYISEYVGEATMLYSTTSSSSNSSSGWSVGGGSKSEGSGKSTSEQPMGRRLLTAEEVGKAEPIITFIDGHKFLIDKLAFWDDIYSAVSEKRLTYYAKNQQDWEDFVDEIRGEKDFNVSRMNYLARNADGKKITLKNTHLTNAPLAWPELPAKQNETVPQEDVLKELRDMIDWEGMEKRKKEKEDDNK